MVTIFYFILFTTRKNVLYIFFLKFFISSASLYYFVNIETFSFGVQSEPHSSFTMENILSISLFPIIRYLFTFNCWIFFKVIKIIWKFVYVLSKFHPMKPNLIFADYLIILCKVKSFLREVHEISSLCNKPPLTECRQLI